MLKIYSLDSYVLIQVREFKLNKHWIIHFSTHFDKIKWNMSINENHNKIHNLYFVESNSFYMSSALLTQQHFMIYVELKNARFRTKNDKV